MFTEALGVSSTPTKAGLGLLQVSPAGWAVGLLLRVGLLVAGLDQEPHLLELGKLCPCLRSSQYQAELNMVLRYTSADGHPRASVSTGSGPAGSALAQEWQGPRGGGHRGLQWLRALGGSQLGTDLCGQHQGRLELLLSRLCTLERPASFLRSRLSAACLCQGEFPTSAALVGDAAELRRSAVRQLGVGARLGPGCAAGAWVLLEVTWVAPLSLGASGQMGGQHCLGHEFLFSKVALPTAALIPPASPFQSLECGAPINVQLSSKHKTLLYAFPPLPYVP